MEVHLLILGGSSEASALAQAVADAGIHATFSYAGRVAKPKPQPVRTRVGGFGGVAGLHRYLLQDGITHVVDATHPFAAQMSAHAESACKLAHVPLTTFARPPWEPGPNDHWRSVRSIDEAVQALGSVPKRVFLGIGRQRAAAFCSQPGHFYLLRFIDPPTEPVPLPRHELIIARGPYDEELERQLLKKHRIDIVVAKNAGGPGAMAKLGAARSLGLPVIMIERPRAHDPRAPGSAAAVLDWLHHETTDRGV